MEAYYSTKIELSGTKEEIKKAISTLQSFSDGDVHLVSTCICNGDERILLDDLHSEEEVAACVEKIDAPIKIEADGPWGSFGELSNVELFKELADVIPFSAFSCHISGQTTYYQEYMDCELKEKKLYITTFMKANEWICEDYGDEVRKTLPYMDFIQLLKLDEKEFDEDRYDEFIEEAQYRSRFLCDNFEEFLDCCGESGITEEEYNVIQKSMKEKGIDFDDFSIDHEAGRTKKEIYDPIESVRIKEKANKTIAGNIQDDKLNVDDCYNGFFKENTIILTVDNTDLDADITIQALMDRGLIDESSLANIEEEYFYVDINKPVLIWNERWKVKVYFEENEYCATYLFLEEQKNEKTEFKLMMTYAEKAFGKALKDDDTDYILGNTRNVYLRKWKSETNWKIELFSASGE